MQCLPHLPCDAPQACIRGLCKLTRSSQYAHERWWLVTALLYNQWALANMGSAVQVVMASACSGHGFKMMSVTGSILADLATKRKTAHDISLFAMTPDRLGARAALHLFTGPKSKM